MHSSLHRAALGVASCLFASVASAQGQEPAPAPADDAAAEASASPFEATLSLNVTTDYVFRGVSQTDERWAAQPSAEVAYKPFYVGAFGSHVDFNTKNPDYELDLLAGVRPTFGSVELDLGAIAYLYEDSDIDYLEGKAAITVTPLETLELGAAVFASPDFLNVGDSGVYVEGTAGYTLPAGFSATGALGHQHVSGTVLENYTTWNLGLAYDPLEAVTLDLRYFDTNLAGRDCVAYSGFKGACDARLVASVRFDLALSQFLSP